MVLVAMSMYTYTVFMSRNDASGNEKIHPRREKKNHKCSFLQERIALPTSEIQSSLK